ncbi:UNVERIFIED_CONTAM: hypothetical protein HDU68_011436, partial [Siphonaria sp. JEL0065]
MRVVACVALFLSLFSSTLNAIPIQDHNSPQDKDTLPLNKRQYSTTRGIIVTSPSQIKPIFPPSGPMKLPNGTTIAGLPQGSYFCNGI